MKYLKVTLILLLIPLLAFSVHKYYISLCEVEYIKEKQSIQVIIGLFIDDLETTLNNEHKKNFFLGTKKEAKNIDSYYENYLNVHLKFFINGKQQPYNYIGKEYDDDLVRFYLEISSIKQLQSLEIENSCLIKEFPEQQNIIKIKAKKFNKTLYLSNNNVKGLLNFQ
ncbi:DUF6702 family protein [Lutibacter sp.]|uniref:DUF6702 family protein n=1 Tax=Lutibacter sp. TaxID=1925666 RepID=UPI0035655543